MSPVEPLKMGLIAAMTFMVFAIFAILLFIHTQLYQINLNLCLQLRADHNIGCVGEPK